MFSFRIQLVMNFKQLKSQISELYRVFILQIGQAKKKKEVYLNYEIATLIVVPS